MRKNKTIYLAPLGLVGITILSGVFLISSDSFATDNTDVVDEVNITVPISCSMEGTGMTSHNANIVNGTYQADIGSTTLKAFCNDDEGFAIYAIGYTDNEYGKTVLTNSTLGTSADIATGTATSGNTSNWAMKLATNTSATYALTLDNGFGSYSSVPATYTKVAHRDSGTDTGTSATGSELTSTYAAYMNQTQPAGTYTGQVKYTLVHPANEEPPHEIACDPGKICYNSNTATALGEMGKQSASNNASVTLYAPNFKRDGYGFAGWNTAYNYSGTNYGPNQTITTPSDVETNGLSLYAVWLPSAGTIQNWDGCSSMNIGDVTALTDNRDNDTYAVAKLADGKCWMIENLRLDNNPELSSANTHNPSLPLTNNYNEDPSQTITSNHLSPAANPTQTTWCTTNSSTCVDQSMLSTNNTTLYVNNRSSSYSIFSNVYSYGNYYNWYSATAGYGKYSVGQHYLSPGDICPTGWHLPTGGFYYEDSAIEDFRALDVAIGGTGKDQSSAEASNRWRSYPNNFILSGRLNYTITPSTGQYWSVTASGYTSAHQVRIDNTSVGPNSYDYKYNGGSIRCVAGV